MLHKTMIIHVRTAFAALYKRRQSFAVRDLKDEWLISIRDEQPRWIGPEIASALQTHAAAWADSDACDRMARLYTEMLKANWGRGPYPESVVKELTRTIHNAVVALAETPCGVGRPKATWNGAVTAVMLIHSFRKILYPKDTPANISDSVWRFLSTCTLPMRNQSSRMTKHEDTWYDLLVRYVVVSTGKSEAPDWAGAHAACDNHPEMRGTIVSQIQASERGGLCTEEVSNIMREAFGMGACPDGQLAADFECLRDFDIDEFLVETGDQASDLESVKAFDDHVRLVSPAPPIPVEDATPEKRKPKREGKRPMVLDAVKIVAEHIEPDPKTRRLVSALDSRKDWRRNDGTLYTYFRVTSNSFTRVAERLSTPSIRILKEEDLLCTDEEPLGWDDGPMPLSATE